MLVQCIWYIPLHGQIFVRHRVLRRISSGCSNPLCFAQVHTIRTRESAVRRNYYSNQSRVEHSSSHITHFTSSTTTTLLITHGRLKFQNYTKVRQPLLSFLCKKYECTGHNVNLKHACVYIFSTKIDANIVSIIWKLKCSCLFLSCKFKIRTFPLTY